MNIFVLSGLFVFSLAVPDIAWTVSNNTLENSCMLTGKVTGIGAMVAGDEYMMVWVNGKTTAFSIAEVGYLAFGTYEGLGSYYSNVNASVYRINDSANGGAAQNFTVLHTGNVYMFTENLATSMTLTQFAPNNNFNYLIPRKANAYINAALLTTGSAALTSATITDITGYTIKHYTVDFSPCLEYLPTLVSNAYSLTVFSLFSSLYLM
jgi:hypothetical protein